MRIILALLLLLPTLGFAQDRIKLQGGSTATIHALRADDTYLYFLKADSSEAKLQARMIDSIYIADPNTRMAIGKANGFLLKRMGLEPGKVSVMATEAEQRIHTAVSAGAYLDKAGRCYNTAATLGGVGMGLGLAGLLVASAKPSDGTPAYILTGGAGICSLIAIGKLIEGNNCLRKAGRLMESQKLSIRVGPMGGGLTYRF